MPKYNKVLVAIDVGDYSDKFLDVIRKFMDSADEVHICTVVMPIKDTYAMIPVSNYHVMVNELQLEIETQAEKGLEAISKELGGIKSHVLVGKAAKKVKELADELACDLIITGTHGKNAVRAMLGSTSNGIFHDPLTDVLAVKVS